ncbi:MAG: DNA repair protein RecN [Acetobacter sp.]|nr:DNA repair protein RecN [Acetobacter sp.]
MLTHLSVRNIVLIESLELPLDKGFTALTGETGAGKSILLDSLGLAMGARTNVSLIRNGAKEAQVSARFRIAPPHRTFTLLLEQGLIVDINEDIVLRRIIFHNGKSRAWINDQPVKLTLLRKIAGTLIEIHAQHNQITLTEIATHRHILDSYGVPHYLLDTVSKTFIQWQELKVELEKSRQAIKKVASEEEWLRHAVQELITLSPQPEEESNLVHQRYLLQQAERRKEILTAALSEFMPRDRRTTSPTAALMTASRALQRLLPSSYEKTQADTADPRIVEVLNTIQHAANAISDVETQLEHLQTETNSSPNILEDVEERLFALRAIARKHHVNVEHLPTLLHDLQTRLDTLESDTTQLVTLEQNVINAFHAFVSGAEKLHTARQEAARRLEHSIAEELKPIKLEKLRFFVDICSLPQEQWSKNGMEQITFLVSTNPGQPPCPLSKITSGGELSRLMLAIKLVIASQSDVSTLIFDEIDTGIGGATAAAVGERLQRLSCYVQVLAITHSPQVAACANTHLRISKQIHNGQTHTLTTFLTDSERKEEIARMLAGNAITESARAAAASLLKQHT